MSILKTIRAQLGLSNTAANNFTLTAEADNGTMKLARGNAGATTQDLITVSATNVVTGGSGAVLVGNGPAFSAYLSGSNQAFTTGTWTKINLNAEDFDTNNNFDSTTNYRFTPTVAGYYQLNGNINVTGSTNITAYGSRITKNGGTIVASNDISVSTTYTNLNSTVSAFVYLNGSTDYVELLGYCTATSPVFTAAASINRFSGFLARSA